MDEMLQYEKKTEEKKRVYTYEKAAERYYNAPARDQFQLDKPSFLFSILRFCTAMHLSSLRLVGEKVQKTHVGVLVFLFRLLSSLEQLSCLIRAFKHKLSENLLNFKNVLSLCWLSI